MERKSQYVGRKSRLRRAEFAGWRLSQDDSDALAERQMRDREFSSTGGGVILAFGETASMLQLAPAIRDVRAHDRPSE